MPAQTPLLELPLSPQDCLGVWPRDNFFYIRKFPLLPISPFQTTKRELLLELLLSFSLNPVCRFGFQAALESRPRGAGWVEERKKKKKNSPSVCWYLVF